MMNCLLGIQAHSNSTRFPDKIYEKIEKVSMLERVYEACKKVKRYSRLFSHYVEVIGIDGDQKLEDHCLEKNLNFHLYAAEEENILNRYLLACAGPSKPDMVIRITADCPLMRSEFIEDVIGQLIEHDYVTNCAPRTYLDGFDVQGIWTSKLLEYAANTKEKEHIFSDLDNGTYMKEFPIHQLDVHRILNPSQMIPNPFLTENKLSVDTSQDLERVRKVWKAQYGK